jgi:hypothetical protein
MFNIFPKTFVNFFKNIVRKPISTDAKQRQNAEYLLISRPTCGRTWVREMLCYIFNEISTVKFNSKSLHAYLYKYSELNNDIPSVKPTHELFLGKETYYDKKIIFLVRDPRDCLVSNGLKIVKTNKNGRNETINEFIDRSDFLERTIELYNNWAVNRDIAQNFLLIRYEDLIQDTFGEMNKIIHFLGLSIDSEVLQKAIEHASLDNLKQAMQKQYSTSEGINRIRKGKKGSYIEELDKQKIIEIEAKINNNLDPIYGYNYNSF